MLSCITQTSNLRQGELVVPGDKSISHRAVIFSSIGEGTSIIHNCLQSEDVTATIEAFKSMGVVIKADQGKLIIYGSGLLGLNKPDKPLYCGNSGTTCRLLVGLLSAQPFDSILLGDDSLSARPMGRVINPLIQIGASIESSSGFLPLVIKGGQKITGSEIDIKVSSAQVFTAVILASLYATNQTKVIHSGNFRDHTQKMMAHLEIAYYEGDHYCETYPIASFQNKDIYVPSDFSSAAFFILLGILAFKDGLRIKNVLINPSRTGLLILLERMGARIEIYPNINNDNHEETADIVAFKSELIGTTLQGDLMQNAIDEIPVLAIAAAFASGETVIRDVEELRVKESDRITSVVDNLKRCGIDCSELINGMTIRGGKMIDAKLNSYNDHRIAMAFIIAGIASNKSIEMIDCNIIDTSFPNFFNVLESLSCNFKLAST
jgi:3-phosphoshikimate 1-carboxyvinyltransferase